MVKRVIPSLAALAELIGDPQVRNRGTIGGSISNNDPAADYPGALLALGATVRTNKREIPADDFFTGMFETALAPRRDRHRGPLPEAREGRLREVPEPGQPLLDGRRVRRPDRRHGAGGGDRRRAHGLPLGRCRECAGPGLLRRGASTG